MMPTGFSLRSEIARLVFVAGKVSETEGARQGWVSREGVGILSLTYVSDALNSSITIYAAGASGNATPVATIAGGNTGLNSPALITF